MNDEEERLLTFISWPTDSPIAPINLARAGFYYTGKDCIIKCYWCDVEVKHLSPEDDIVKIHKSMSPNCAFITNPFTSNNIPIFRTGRNFVDDSTLDLKTYEARLITFINWPYGQIVKAENLAAAGFYCLGHGDKVRCAFCYGIAAYWEPGDDPMFEHKRHFPKCKFVLADFNITKLKSYHEISAKSQISSYAAFKNHQPKPIAPEYDTRENRLASFSKWPVDKQQRPIVLADAGFFYLGIKDKVQCFYCGGILRNWQPEDDVWVEHARWFPACSFMKFVKGLDFIKNHTEEITSDSEETATYTSTTISAASRPSSSFHIIQSVEIANVTLNDGPSGTKEATDEPSKIAQNQKKHKSSSSREKK